jgi:formylmethanofuran--tetrahydromethanopterin N-formyltransferase
MRKILKEDQWVLGKRVRNVETGIKVIGYDEKDQSFIVSTPLGNTVRIVDTYAEMFPMWAGRILITADTEKWALTAANTATGLATSVIMSPAESAIETTVPPEKTPDNRPGVLIQVYNRNRFELMAQMILRIGQCVMTCPTTAAFDALPSAKRRLKVGRSLCLFGDGFQRKRLVGERKVWKIPVMEGDFTVEDKFGAAEAIAGGNFLILARDKNSGLKAAEDAVNAIRAARPEVIMPFPDGICRSGSKAGSLKYKLKASTFHQFCPQLRTLVPDTQVPEDVGCVYEIVINGLTLQAVKSAMRAGVRAAANVQGVARVTAGNYGGKLGPNKAFLKEVLDLE